MRTFEQVQVQLRLPPSANTSEQHCSSSSAHESLRRFAKGYVFGAPSRIGNPETLHHNNSKSPSFQSCNSSTAFQNANKTNFASKATTTSGPLSVELKPIRKGHNGKRNLLLFGPHAPKLELPVKERIERRPIPKRCREQFTIEALTAMMDKLLERPSYKRAKSNYSSHTPSSHFSKITCNPEKSAESEPKAQNDRRRFRLNRKIPSKEIEAIEDNTTTSTEDDDTTDELSFLVDRCNINSSKEQPFMPYIT